MIEQPLKRNKALRRFLRTQLFKNLGKRLKRRQMRDMRYYNHADNETYKRFMT